VKISVRFNSDAAVIELIAIKSAANIRPHLRPCEEYVPFSGLKSASESAVTSTLAADLVVWIWNLGMGIISNF
jgi:hypothetical protein